MLRNYPNKMFFDFLTKNQKICSIYRTNFIGSYLSELALLVKKNMKVKMYSTPSCGYCNLAKDFFDEKGIEVEVFDVSVDEKKRQELVDKSGQMGVPVIEIGDEIVVGFDQAKISNLLSL